MTLLVTVENFYATLDMYKEVYKERALRG